VVPTPYKKGVGTLAPQVVGTGWHGGWHGSWHCVKDLTRVGFGGFGTKNNRSWGFIFDLPQRRRSPGAAAYYLARKTPAAINKKFSSAAVGDVTIFS